METFFRNERQSGVVKKEFKRGWGDRAPAYNTEREKETRKGETRFLPAWNS